MIPVNFIHSSLPIGGERVHLPVLPRRHEIVRLKEENYVVTLVSHIVEEKAMAPYVAYVHLEVASELFSRNPSPY